MKFNSLPPEIRLEIFSFLTVSEVMRVRRVCKQWNDLLNSQIKFKRLFCVQTRPGGESYLKSGLSFESARIFLDRTSNDSKFSRVKYLMVSLCPNYDELKDVFGLLNTFKFLNEAVVDCYVADRDRSEIQDQTFVLSLDRLEKVAIFFTGETIVSKVSVVFDLPKLSILVLDEFKSITIGHPKRLRTLAVANLFQGLDYTQLTGLTRLYADEQDRQSITASFLENLPALLELHLDAYYLHNEKLLLDLLEPIACGKPSLRILFYGFEISQTDLATGLPDSYGLSGLNEDAASFIIRNRHRSIDNNQFVTSIQYNLISALDDNELFGVFLQKFPKIRQLNVIGNVPSSDTDRLLKFINKFKLEQLSFVNTGLPAAFFKKLAKNCSPNIRQLEIEKDASMNILSGDFDFVFELKHLISLIIGNCRMPLNYLARLVEELKQISLIQFSQTANYDFRMNLCRCQNVAHHTISLKVDATHRHGDPSSGIFLRYEIPHEEGSKLVNELKSRLKADGEFVCAKQLFIVLLQIEAEEAIFRLSMNKCVYDQTYSICLSKEQIVELFQSQ